jgi:hypothetical protein
MDRVSGRGDPIIVVRSVCPGHHACCSCAFHCDQGIPIHDSPLRPAPVPRLPACSHRIQSRSRAFEKQVSLLFGYRGFSVEYSGDGKERDGPDLLAHIPRDIHRPRGRNPGQPIETPDPHIDVRLTPQKPLPVGARLRPSPPRAPGSPGGEPGRGVARIPAESEEAPEAAVTAENLCYVVYTSGSTGCPNGAAMRQRGVCNYIHWGVRAYGAGRRSLSPWRRTRRSPNLLPLFAGRPVRLLPEASPGRSASGDA